MAEIRSNRVDVGRATILWAATARTPVSVDVTASHAALVLGDAIHADDAGRTTATNVASQWLSGHAKPEAYDGFHAAAVVAGDGRVVVGADVLGYFPVYYVAMGDVLLVGASPELFRGHPAFRAAVSLEGLFTVLMLCGPFRGRCLLEGVRRLGVGRVLSWRPGEDAREIPQYDPPREQRHAALSFDEQVDMLYHAYDTAVRRHHPADERTGLLLSGGRDSRLLAGCLAAHGNAVDALTIGLATDDDVSFAAQVAEELGFVHHVAMAPYEEFVSYATRSARWEHLAGGMGAIHTWGDVAPCRTLPARTGNGYSSGRDVGQKPRNFAGALERVTRRGIGPETLRTLVRGGESRDIIDGLIARLREEYDVHASADPAEAAFQLSSVSFHRFYIGGIPWRLSFGSWPVMAVLDRAFLDAWIGIPIAAQADRRAIEAVLARRFPRLARLPLDRNAPTTHPIAPSLAYRIRQQLYRVPRAARRPPPPAVAAIERRQYYRLYDLDNPGWSAIRRAAEPYRAGLAQWFDPAVVDRILPPPNVPAHITDPMTDGFDAKMLLGLMFWLLDHTTS